jgi:hypothetical protein
VLALEPVINDSILGLRIPEGAPSGSQLGGLLRSSVGCEYGCQPDQTFVGSVPERAADAQSQLTLECRPRFRWLARE